MHASLDAQIRGRSFRRVHGKVALSVLAAALALVLPAVASAADFDGDAKSDVAIWSPFTLQWRVLGSFTGAHYSAEWGHVGDKPVAGDYDGDGKADYAMWHPS